MVDTTTMWNVYLRWFGGVVLVEWFVCVCVCGGGGGIGRMVCVGVVLVEWFVRVGLVKWFVREWYW